MNLWVVGWRAGGGIDPATPAGALRATLARLPFLPGEDLRSWAAPSRRAAAAWVAHAPGRVGGVEYAHQEERRLALFSGRPFAWGDDDEPDGLGPLDPRTYLRPLRELAPTLDGRWAAVRCDDDEGVLEAGTDALGAYPIFQARGGDGAVWLSNNPSALRPLAGEGGLDHAALASVLGAGWSLGGHPVWRGVRRVRPGSVLRLGDGAAEERLLLPDHELARLFGAGLDASAAAATLVKTVRGLAGWPGRPDVVPVTGGRDSRVVLAAALRAGLSFEATTGGPPDAPDVRVGRALCERVGIAHHPLEGDPHGTALTRPWEAARILAVASGGTATLADAAGFPLGPRTGPLVLWHSGQGGEMARDIYAAVRGRDARGLSRALYRRIVARRPGRPELLSPPGRALVLAALRDWTEGRLAAGVAPADVPDAFFVLERTATWAAPTHGAVEWVRDATSPLWSYAMLPHLLGLEREERRLEVFHRRLLEELGPELLDVPFAAGGWRVARGPLGTRAARARTLGGKAAAQARRRWAARRPATPAAAPATGGRAAAAPPLPAADGGGLGALMEDARERVLGATAHPAWEVLDRRRVERLLSRPPEALDEMSRYHVWRLVTVFGGDLLA